MNIDLTLIGPAFNSIHLSVLLNIEGRKVASKRITGIKSLQPLLDRWSEAFEYTYKLVVINIIPVDSETAPISLVKKETEEDFIVDNK